MFEGFFHSYLAHSPWPVTKNAPSDIRIEKVETGLQNINADGHFLSAQDLKDLTQPKETLDWLPMKKPYQSLGSDNHSGVHPRFFESLLKTNVGHAPSYGTDEETHRVNKVFKKLFGDEAETYFVFNGTAANVLCLKSLIQSHESVICAETSHLNRDECGAPEFIIGCKLVTVESFDGKVTPKQVESCIKRMGDQHTSQPKLVSLTQPTELGTVYSMKELRSLKKKCEEYHLFLHIDGARLIYAANYLKCELIDIAQYADAISFGGTKNGLLMGEAVLLFHPLAKKNFKFLRKQCMQLPSKMRFISTQFQELFSPERTPLWKTIAYHGHQLAIYLSQKIEEFPEITVTQKVQSNAVFAKIPKEWHKSLRENFFFYVWDEITWEVRWMLSFDSTKDNIDQFIEHIRLTKKQIHPIHQG